MLDISILLQEKLNSNTPQEAFELAFISPQVQNNKIDKSVTTMRWLCELSLKYQVKCLYLEGEELLSAKTMLGICESWLKELERTNGNY